MFHLNYLIHFHIESFISLFLIYSNCSYFYITGTLQSFSSASSSFWMFFFFFFLNEFFLRIFLILFFYSLLITSKASSSNSKYNSTNKTAAAIINRRRGLTSSGRVNIFLIFFFQIPFLINFITFISSKI